MCTSFGYAAPRPVSIRDLRLIRNMAHLVPQWCINSDCSFQSRCWKKNAVASPSCLRSKLIWVSTHSSGSADHLPQHALVHVELHGLRLCVQGLPSVFSLGLFRVADAGCSQWLRAVCTDYESNLGRWRGGSVSYKSVSIAHVSAAEQRKCALETGNAGVPRAQQRTHDHQRELRIFRGALGRCAGIRWRYAPNSETALQAFDVKYCSRGWLRRKRTDG